MSVCTDVCTCVFVGEEREAAEGASDFQMPTEWELGLGGPLGI